MLFDLQTLDGLIDLSHLAGLDLILGELGLLLLLLLEQLVLPVLQFGLTVSMDVLLSLSHGLFDLLNATHFLVKLALDFLEDSDTLLLRSALLLHLHEDGSQLVAEVNEVLVDLGHLVECDAALAVVSDCHDEVESIALVEQALDLVPVAVESQHFFQSGELDVREEVLALLDDADGESFLDEWLVLLEVGHDFDSFLESIGAKLGDLEGRLLEFDKLVQASDVWVTHDIVNVLDEDLMDQRLVRGDTLDLEHLRDLEDLLCHSLRVFKFFAKLLGQVVSGQTLETGQSAVEGSTERTEDDLT